MLKELSRYENLGTLNYFWELLHRLEENQGVWTRANIGEYFFNRIVDGKTVFDGCVPFAVALGIIKIEGEIVSVDPDFSRFLMSERYLQGKFLERVFSALQQDEAFQGIFASSRISYDVVYHLIQIDIGAFGLRHANFRQVLLDFGFLTRHPDKTIRKFIINPKYRRLFDIAVLPEIKKRKLGISDLEAMMERRQIQGGAGEDFVVEFEKTRLAAHPNVGKVERISDYDVAAGYDIVSYENLPSQEYDRFIEVKSCSVDRRFYWSKNEVAQSRIKRNRYFLYLVDPEKISVKGYTPMIVQNPYENIFLNEEWSREPQSWLFQKDS